MLLQDWAHTTVTIQEIVMVFVSLVTILSLLTKTILIRNSILQPLTKRIKKKNITFFVLLQETPQIIYVV